MDRILRDKARRVIGEVMPLLEKRLRRLSEQAEAQPLEVFAATLDDVREGRILANARSVAWRLGRAEVVVRGDDVAFASLAENTISAGEGTKLLRIPALYITALWHSDDTIEPLDGLPQGRYDEARFTEAARALL